MDSRTRVAFLWWIVITNSWLPTEVLADLQAGAAAVDISPTEFPLNMPGGFSANMGDSVHDPFYSRAMVLSDGPTTIAMVVVDSLGVAPEVLDAAKDLAARETGMSPYRMLVCSTHTHSGPPSNVQEGPAPAVAYRQRLIEGIAESIVRAHAAMRPADFGAARWPKRFSTAGGISSQGKCR